MKNYIAILLAFLAIANFSQSFAQIVAGRGIEIHIQGVQAEEKTRIDGSYSVANTGTVRMPMVGEIAVAGMSTNAAAAKLEEAYKTAGIYNNVTFQVIATGTEKGPREEQITVSGSVNSPGAKPFTPGLTLFQAVAHAGGADAYGNLRNVLLMRGKTSQVYNLENMEDRNIPLLANDTIEVKEKSINPFKKN